MAEVLGVVAAVPTLLGFVSNILRIVRELNECQDELSGIGNEVRQLQALLFHVKHLALEDAVAEMYLADPLHSSWRCLEAAERFLQRLHRKSKRARALWHFEKRDVLKYQRDIGSSNQQILIALSTINAYGISKPSVHEL